MTVRNMTIATSLGTPRELVIDVYRVDSAYNDLMFESSWTTSATQPASPQRSLQGALERGHISAAENQPNGWLLKSTRGRDRPSMVRF